VNPADGQFPRRLLSVAPTEVPQNRNSDMQQPSRESEDGVNKTKKKKAKGWDGEVPDPNLAMAPLGVMDGMSTYPQ